MSLCLSESGSFDSTVTISAPLSLSILPTFADSISDPYEPKKWTTD